MLCKPVLVDKRNYEELLPQLLKDMAEAKLIGLDTETHNEEAHEQMKLFNKSDETKAFDWQRIVVTGYSIYPFFPDREPVAYYINLGHADVENRLTFEQARVILDAKQPDVSWVAHNAAFELTVMQSNLKWKPENIICTMQMAVTAYGPDEYDHNKFIEHQFGKIKELFPEAQKLFKDYDPSSGRDNMAPAQAELLAKVIGKSSDAGYSYNGVIDDICYGYGLKKAVRSFFNYDMVTFEEVLGDKKHMGELTGEEVVAYGADDAYWAVKLFFRLHQYMTENCPEAIETFFSQENPMVHIFANIRLQGMRVNKPAIISRRDQERIDFAKCIRNIKATIRDLLPFPTELNEKLAKYDKWYATKGQLYRDRLETWAKSADSPDDYEQSCQVSSAVSNAWSGGKCDGISINHYYQSRLMMYDLTRMGPIIYKGKVSSDSECRGEIREKIKTTIKALGDNETAVAFMKRADKLVELMGELSSIEQRMKLYLTPYLMLTDPVTNRMYPDLSSNLATRRMACSNPNAQQLAKRGDSTYVRGFFLADAEDELLVSIDWSQIELVLIGEFSGDPEFAKAYGTLPYQDLHIGTTVDVLKVMIPELTMEIFKNCNKMDIKDIPPALLVKPNGEPLDPSKAKKFWRTEVGKGSNFNYWYSGALATVGEKLGWNSEQMWAATQAYRERFAVAEAWRVQTIEQTRHTGFVQLPDGLRRVRWESTHEWATISRRLFEAYGDQGLTGILRFGEQIMKAVRSRAASQLINALIQGSCATLAKRSIIRINQGLAENGIRARFKMAIHDELLFSVHRDDIVKFIAFAKGVMKSHKDIIKNLEIDATVSIGKTFEPWNPKHPTMCQIELDECPNILGFEEGSKLNEEQIQRVIDEYIFAKAA